MSAETREVNSEATRDTRDGTSDGTCCAWVRNVLLNVPIFHNFLVDEDDTIWVNDSPISISERNFKPVAIESEYRKHQQKMLNEKRARDKDREAGEEKVKILDHSQSSSQIPSGYVFSEEKEPMASPTKKSASMTTTATIDASFAPSFPRFRSLSALPLPSASSNITNVTDVTNVMDPPLTLQRTGSFRSDDQMDTPVHKVQALANALTRKHSKEHLDLLDRISLLDSHKSDKSSLQRDPSKSDQGAISHFNTPNEAVSNPILRHHQRGGLDIFHDDTELAAITSSSSDPNTTVIGVNATSTSTSTSNISKRSRISNDNNNANANANINVSSTKTNRPTGSETDKTEEKKEHSQQSQQSQRSQQSKKEALERQRVLYYNNLSSKRSFDLDINQNMSTDSARQIKQACATDPALLVGNQICLLHIHDSQGSAKHGTALDEEDIDERLCPLSQRICVVVDFECSSISTSTNIDITKAEKEMKSGDKSVDAPAPNPDPVKFLLMKSNGELEWKDLSTRIYRNLPIRKEASDFTILRQITFDVEE